MDHLPPSKTPLHSVKPSPCTVFNRIFALIYTISLLFLVYYHATKLLTSTTIPSFFISIFMFIADLILGFMWISCQAFRLCPVTRQVFPEYLENFVDEKDFPAMDVFICTADPYKEPPVNVANTALSLMAYDYPMEKLSVYVSDDGGSELTLFALVEAAEFGAHWLAFCRENKVMDRFPEAFFRSMHYPINSEVEKIKAMYDKMKKRIEHVVESGKVDEYMNNAEHEAFRKWRDEQFTRQDHPTVIQSFAIFGVLFADLAVSVLLWPGLKAVIRWPPQVLLESNKDKDVAGRSMPNLIYVSREKRRTSPHHFKAGALNTLLRVSAIMTNAPIILTQDCDMFSNDPRTPYNVLCYFVDASIRPELAYVQFPQCFHGLNRNDIYSSEMKRWFHINPEGMDGLSGPDNMGSGCFFMRRAFFGGPSPSSFVQPEMSQLSPDHVVSSTSTSITSENVVVMTNIVAGCNYEDRTKWGSEVGFRYGSLVEDYFTGYCLHSLGWKSIFCHPHRPAFLGDVPNSLLDVMNQHKRWCVGLLEVAFSNYSPLTFGMRYLGPLHSLCYANYALSPIWPIPIIIYSFLPQLTLLNNVFIFPKASSWWFFLYVFLFLGSYAQDCLEFILAQGTLARWWNEQRIWLIRGFTSYFFGSLEYLSKNLGFGTRGFNVTSKAVDGEQSKRYDQGLFDFGPSPASSLFMFLPLAAAAVINLVAILGGLMQILKGSGEYFDGAFLQVFVSGFGSLNCLPIYEAMVLRSDEGKMPVQTTICAAFLAWGLYLATHFFLKNL